MKTVVITGSARGFGFEMAKVFRANNFNVVLSDINQQGLNDAKQELLSIKSQADIVSVVCDVTSHEMLEQLWNTAKQAFGGVDIWINNAGVNQPDKPIFELTKKEIDFLLDIDLKGAIYGSQIAFARMKEQGYGQIYNIEGYGSNDAMMTGLNLYGTSKRAITHFTQALAKESKEITNNNVKVCRLTPGIMITGFITSANGGKTKVELPEKTKKVYNILGDYPETIAEFAVPRMIKNNKNNAKITWLTGARAMGRFLTAGFKKRNLFD
jgi:NAD(P)-dependent dehydrogenase (short-subunit alcohol dehydrogenase family)